MEAKKEMIRFPVSMVFERNPVTGEMEKKEIKYIEITEEICEKYWEDVMKKAAMVGPAKEGSQTLGQWLGI